MLIRDNRKREMASREPAKVGDYSAYETAQEQRVQGHMNRLAGYVEANANPYYVAPVEYQKVCPICGIDFVTRLSRVKTCSHACAGKLRSRTTRERRASA